MSRLKNLLLFALLFTTVGCHGVPVEDAADDAQQTVQAEEQTDVTFSMEDLCLYGEPEDGVCPPVIWLGMDKNEIDPNNAYMACFSGSDIAYENANASDGSSTQAVSFINYKGGTRRPLRTVKAIVSTGVYTDPANPNSTADEVIEKYGIDPAAEGIDTTAESYTIDLRFAENDDQTLTRILTDNEDDTLKTDYILRFVITDNYVTGIQMMHK